MPKGLDSTDRLTRQTTLGSLLTVVVLAIYLAVIWFLVTKAYQTQPLQTGRFVTGQTYVGENYAGSLDLRIVSKAVYSSSPITKVQDLNTTDGVTQSTVNFQVPTDHLTEYALMSRPASAMPAGGYPVIILCHGYYNPSQYQTTSGYINDMHFYARHGFVVIKPDFRGQGLSKHQGRPEGTYYSMAYNTDLMSLIAAVKKTDYLDKSNISLWGHSMGAYIALRAAVLSPDIKRLILLSTPVGYAGDKFKSFLPGSDKDNPVALRLRGGLLLKYGSPAVDPNFWNTTTPLNFLDRLSAQVQIHVGSADIVVPPQFSAELDSALGSVHKVHQYYVYPNGTHGLLPQRQLIWSRSLAALGS